jgi:hypothetical protein
MPNCPKCGRAMASVLTREGGVVRMYYECPACPRSTDEAEGQPPVRAADPAPSHE